MPDMIGPIAHLLPKKPNRQESSPGSPKGREFSETLESRSRQKKQETEDRSAPASETGPANSVQAGSGSNNPADRPSSEARASSRSQIPGEGPTSDLHHVSLPDEEAIGTDPAANKTVEDNDIETPEVQTDTISERPSEPSTRAPENSPAIGSATEADAYTLKAEASTSATEALVAPSPDAERTLSTSASIMNADVEQSVDSKTGETSSASHLNETNGAAAKQPGVAEEASLSADEQTPESAAARPATDPERVGSALPDGSDPVRVRSAAPTGTTPENEAGTTGQQNGEEKKGPADQSSFRQDSTVGSAELNITPKADFAAEGARTGEPLLQSAAASQSVVSLSAGQATSPTTLAASAPPGTNAALAPVMMVAAPEEVVDIFSTKLANGDKPDRITVQLDPPELGRVSIEFKYDAQGLQQVAVRAETADAVRQLRLMHFDLVQSLEQHGLSARDMTFSEGFTGGSGQQPETYIDYSGVAHEDAATALVHPSIPQVRTPITLGASGLNIKL